MTRTTRIRAALVTATAVVTAATVSVGVSAAKLRRTLEAHQEADRRPLRRLERRAADR